MASMVTLAFLSLLIATLVLLLLYTYIISKRLEKYGAGTFNNSILTLSLICAASGSVFLIISASMRPEALVPGSRVPFSYLHSFGMVFILTATILIYSVLINTLSMFSGEKTGFQAFSLLFISIFAFSIYYTISLSFYEPVDGILASLNFTCTIDILILVMSGLKKEMELSKRIAMVSDLYIYSMLLFLSYHLFYQIHAFLSKIIPVVITPGYVETMNTIRIIFTIIPAIIAFSFFFVSLRKITRMPEIRERVRDHKSVIPFLEEVSHLIGESTMTIYGYGLENYKKSYPAEKENDELYNYLVKYFEGYIGPISLRIAREVEIRNKEEQDRAGKENSGALSNRRNN